MDRPRCFALDVDRRVRHVKDSGPLTEQDLSGKVGGVGDDMEVDVPAVDLTLELDGVAATLDGFPNLRLSQFTECSAEVLDSVSGVFRPAWHREGQKLWKL